jgi:predicted metal-dependent peptidase|tara:strand:- start:3870 stop:5042 length:1173 start_codon:yes stop_codon:yes gene_type:complete
MVKTAEERITQSRVRLLLTKPFFGQLAVRLKIEDASDYMPTAATDGRRFLFNRDFVNSLTDDMLDFLVGHEVLHCVFDHMQARGDRKPMLYNAAADYNINMTLVEQNIGKPITEDKLEGGKICLDWKYSGWNSYEIYDDLLKNQQDAKGMDVHMNEISNEDGEGEGQNVEMSEEEKKMLADEIKQATIQAAQAAGEGVPDAIKRMISELVAPKMDWRDILRTQLESSLKNDFTFMRPSKRSGDVIFPGMNKDEELNIAVALDTSGSISPVMLRDFLSEVQGIMDQYQAYRVHIFQFDTGVYGAEDFTSDDGRTMDEYELKGGGGTDFDVVFNYMEEYGIEPDQLVMFTDGYPWGSWGNAEYCDTLFVIHGDKQRRLQSPFGVTVHYDEAA